MRGRRWARAVAAVRACAALRVLVIACWLGVTACALGLAGCGAVQETQASALRPAEVTGGATVGGSGTGGFPVTVVDDYDRAIAIPARPQRIVSLAPSNTEILFSIGAGSRVVGVDDYSNYPAEASAIAGLGGFSNPNMETIARLRPDLAIGTSMHEKYLPKFGELRIPLLILEPRTLAEVSADIELLGRATGEEEPAARAAEALAKRLQAISEKVALIPAAERPRVFYEVYNDPLMTAGPHTFIAQLISLAGGVSIAGDVWTDYPEFSSEAVISRNPQIIVYPEYHGSTSSSAAEIAARPGWSAVEAVREGRIYAIDADIMSRPGPRIAEAAELLHEMFYGQQPPIAGSDSK